MSVSSGQVVAVTALVGHAGAPVCQCNTCIRVWPALSCCRACHWPVACRVWRISSSHCGSVRGRCKALRHVLICSARLAAGCCQFCQCALPASCCGHWARSCRRKCVSMACTSAAVTRLVAWAVASAWAACVELANSLSQASTASLLAWGEQARNSSMRWLAAMVVESFQPVSSRTASS